MKYLLVLILQLFSFNTIFGQNIDTSIINLSRKSSLKIIGYDDNKGYSYGTGFLVNIYGAKYVITCLHVVTKATIVKNSKTYTAFRYLKGITYKGDTIDLNIETLGKSSIPNIYMNRDFCILNASLIKKDIPALPILLNDNEINVGENIYTSGYPLMCPLLTHTGIISGYDADTSIIFIQSALNEGNSGGAVINKKGQVVGIVDFKWIPSMINFDTYLDGLQSISSKGSYMGSQIHDGKGNVIEISGTQFNYNLVKTLKDNLNTGIGGAINIKYIRKCLYK